MGCRQSEQWKCNSGRNGQARAGNLKEMARAKHGEVHVLSCAQHGLQTLSKLAPTGSQSGNGTGERGNRNALKEVQDKNVSII